MRQSIEVNSDPRLRVYDHGKDCLLVCIPPAGVGASVFSSWVSALSDVTDLALVQLPGREDTFELSIESTLPELAVKIADMISKTTYKKLTIFGHSMGATIGWWTASQLFLIYGKTASVIVSAQVPDPVVIKFFSVESWFDYIGEPVPDIYSVPELGDILKKVLVQDIDWMKAEFNRPLQGPYPLPLIGICGISDHMISAQKMAYWQNVTTYEFDLLSVSGGHLNLLTQPDDMLQIVRSYINRNT